MVRLNPLDIFNKEFKKGFSLWSYKKDEVDDFLDQVGRDYEELYNELNKLQEENSRLKEQLENCAQQEKSLRQELQEKTGEFEAKKSKIEKESEVVVKEARLKAQEIINEAEEKAKEYYSRYQRLKELEQLFRVRFRTFLETHIKYLEKQEEDPLLETGGEEEITNQEEENGE